MLERTPRKLRALLQDHPSQWFNSNEGEGTWSPFEVLGHLVHVERVVWMERIQKVLDGTHAPFAAVNRDAQFTESMGKGLEDLLNEFTIARGETLSTLREMHLSPSDLQRTGLHPSLGVVSLKELLATFVSHDLTHIAQIVRTMSKQYRSEIGPWAKREHYVKG